ncbi:MAG: hypothetical protein LBL66_04630 [Clostridiales bacterium]|nr:hypothetical protein [Clostridiales bacterium]
MRGGRVKRLTKQSLPNTKRAYLYRDCRVAFRAPRNDPVATLFVHSPCAEQLDIRHKLWYNNLENTRAYCRGLF